MRSRAVGRKDRGRATGKRKVSGVAQAIGEEKTRDTVATVGFAHAQDALRVEFGANDHVVMKMHATLGRAGAAGGVKPEGSVVLAGRFGFELGGRIVHQVMQV